MSTFRKFVRAWPWFACSFLVVLLAYCGFAFNRWTINRHQDARIDEMQERFDVTTQAHMDLLNHHHDRMVALKARDDELLEEVAAIVMELRLGMEAGR